MGVLTAISPTGEVVTFDKDEILTYMGDDNKWVIIKRGTWGVLEGLVPLILQYNSGSIVEIGMGESTEILAKHAEAAGQRLYSCDLQMGGMFEVFDKELFDGHICYIGKSKDFIHQFLQWHDNPSIVFIDGDHTYETVKMEVEFFLSMLKDNGVIFMHDTFPRNQEQADDTGGMKPGKVYKVRQELERRSDIDVFTWPFSAINTGLTMVMKHMEDRPYWRSHGLDGLNEAN